MKYTVKTFSPQISLKSFSFFDKNDIENYIHKENINENEKNHHHREKSLKQSGEKKMQLILNEKC